jgi:hypothetical protein
MMAYHEERTEKSGNAGDDTVKGINDLESISRYLNYGGGSFLYNITKLMVEDDLFFCIFSGHCSCDFFTPYLNELQQDFSYFIGERTHRYKINPYILVTWEDNLKIDNLPVINDLSAVKNMPGTVFNISRGDIHLSGIFNKKNPVGLYCIKYYPDTGGS